MLFLFGMAFNRQNCPTFIRPTVPKLQDFAIYKGQLWEQKCVW